MSEATEVLCACGKPLHYNSILVRQYVEATIAEMGETLQVAVDGVPGRYIVQRHYLALHGLRAADLEALVLAGTVQRAPAFFPTEKN